MCRPHSHPVDNSLYSLDPLVKGTTGAWIHCRLLLFMFWHMHTPEALYPNAMQEDVQDTLSRINITVYCGIGAYTVTTVQYLVHPTPGSPHEHQLAMTLTAVSRSIKQNTLLLHFFTFCPLHVGVGKICSVQGKQYAPDGCLELCQ